MNNTEENKDTNILMEDIGEGLGYLQEFVSLEVESVKLEMAERISIASSTMITGVILTSVGTLFFIFAAIALGFYLGSRLDSDALGFLIVSGVFLVLLLIVFLFRKTLITDKVVAAVIHLFYYQDQDETH